MNFQLEKVYTLLDYGNASGALSECTRLLKNQQHNTHILALKALALARLQRNKEATEITGFLLKSNLDQESSNALLYALKALSRFADIENIYSRACQQDPLNPDLALNHFLAVTRTNNPALLQATALKLNKSFKSTIFYFYNVYATLNQGYSNPSMATTLYFPLAKRMLEKIKDSIITYDTFVLYTDVLIANNLIQDAIDLAMGPMGIKCFKMERERLRFAIDLLVTVDGHTQVLEMSRILVDQEYFLLI